MARTLDRMPAPRTPYEAVLHAARDVAKLDDAFTAEQVGTALLGSVYALASEDRAAAVREFVGGFLAATARRKTAAATTIRAVFAALVPDAAGAAQVRPAAVAPSWTVQLGRVRLTGTYAYGDVYGDQTSYVATFAYDDPSTGGPEHTLVALIDHNIGVVKDVFVGGPADRILAEIRQLCAADELTWFEEKVEPARMRFEVARHLEITDAMSGLPRGDSLATDRMLAGVRLALLPDDHLAEPTPLDPAGRRALAADFLASPEAAAAGLTGLDDAEQLSLSFSVSLILDHAETFPDADALRWSPVMAELFLLDWVQRRASLGPGDAEMLPRVLRAWVAYAARRRGLPDRAVAQTSAAIDDLVPEFARLTADR